MNNAIVGLFVGLLTVGVLRATVSHVGSPPDARPLEMSKLLAVLGGGYLLAFTAPAWLPLVLTRTAPELLARLQLRFSSRAPRRWPLAPLLPIIACLAGGGWLLWIGFRG